MLQSTLFSALEKSSTVKVQLRTRQLGGIQLNMAQSTSGSTHGIIFFLYTVQATDTACCGGCNGLMPSALKSKLSSPPSRPSYNILLRSYTRHLTVTMPLFTQVYKWVPTNLMLGMTRLLPSIPFRGSRNTQTGDT